MIYSEKLKSTVLKLSKKELSELINLDSLEIIGKILKIISIKQEGANLRTLEIFMNIIQAINRRSKIKRNKEMKNGKRTKKISGIHKINKKIKAKIKNKKINKVIHKIDILKQMKRLMNEKIRKITGEKGINNKHGILMDHSQNSIRKDMRNMQIVCMINLNLENLKKGVDDKKKSRKIIRNMSLI